MTHLSAFAFIVLYLSSAVLSIQIDSSDIIRTEFGDDENNANVVSIQPVLSDNDFCQVAHLNATLRSYFEEASMIGWFKWSNSSSFSAKNSTFVLLPEGIGIAFALAHSGFPCERTDIQKGTGNLHSLANAAKAALKNSKFSFLKTFLTPRRNELNNWLQKLDSTHVFDDYVKMLSGFALQYHVTIIGGSIFRQYNSKDITYNVVPIVLPDGTLHRVTPKQSFPPKEFSFISPGTAYEPSLIETSALNFCVIFESDTWDSYPYYSCYLHSQGKNFVILSPSSFIETTAERWKTSITTHPQHIPSDATVNLNTTTKIEALEDFGLFGRTPQNTISVGSALRFRDCSGIVSALPFHIHTSHSLPRALVSLYGSALVEGGYGEVNEQSQKDFEKGSILNVWIPKKQPK